MESAIIKDISKDYIEAVGLYEESIKTGSASLEMYTNLAFLYWEFAAEQMSFNIPNNIPGEWSLIGGNRYGEIIEQGLKKYPNSLELKFWKKYLPYRLFGKEFTQQECEQLVLDYKKDNNLVPYFYLYLFCRKKYKAERDKLFKLCENIRTAKFIYIKSLIARERDFF
ncbi:MAG: hypothetical protein AB8B69_18265 [Chitinophagales bacterium]